MFHDCLLEIQTEELPAKGLYHFGFNFNEHMITTLKKANLSFSTSTFFITPRRLAVHVKQLEDRQTDCIITQRGPAKQSAFDAAGTLTAAGLGFVRAQAITPDQLIIIRSPEGTPQQEWIGVERVLAGQSTVALLPKLMADALASFALAKRMRWGESSTQFLRPVHAVLLLYGSELIHAHLLNCHTTNTTHTHRVLAKTPSCAITTPESYENILAKEAYVIADFDKRRTMILEQLQRCLAEQLGQNATLCEQAPFSQYPDLHALLEEVTGLVEWPTVFLGQFDANFLTLPAEILLSAMQDHQRYFPIVSRTMNALLPYFLVVSNIPGDGANNIIPGNERVLRARLNDARFFYETDKKQPLTTRLKKLQHIIFHEKLGTLYDKTERLCKLAEYLAEQLKAPLNEVKRAALLAKIDLSTLIVGEFPALQGVMGGYYAACDGENELVSEAIKQHYLPRFANDRLPKSLIAQILGISDRVDILVGTFGVNQAPSGDKDPYGLRRAAIGLLRILIEKQCNIALEPLLAYAMTCYSPSVSLNTTTLISDILAFIYERLRIGYQQKGIDADCVTSVMTLGLSNVFDIDQRIQAVQQFKISKEAPALITAHKRIGHLLSKCTEPVTIEKINPAYFEQAIEKILFQEWHDKQLIVNDLCNQGAYPKALHILGTFTQPINDFFEDVFIMTDHKEQRHNRLILLHAIRHLFLQIADIALLSVK